MIIATMQGKRVTDAQAANIKQDTNLKEIKMPNGSYIGNLYKIGVRARFTRFDSVQKGWRK